MNSWSRNRKRLILSILILAVGILVGLPIFFLFRSTPTCTDGAMSGDETGVDCGGSCQRLCPVESLPLVVEGDARVLTLATSTYEIVAVVKNPNTSAQVTRARYTLKAYAPGSLVATKTVTAETFVPAGAEFALFAGAYAADEGAMPTRATLEWDQASLLWEKNVTQPPTLEVGETVFSRLTSAPRLDATIKNTTLEGVRNIDLTALLYDASGTIFAASKTFIDSLPASGETQAVFTWPRPFGEEVTQVKVIGTVLPGQALVR